MAPVLKDFRGTKTITLPGYDDSQVVIYDGLLMKDASKLEQLKKDLSNMDAIADLFGVMIKEWNFVDEEQKPLPVDRENIGKLDVQAITFLAETIREAIEDKKKATTP